MSGLDDWRKDDEPATKDDSEESVSYVEISSVDHPEAYSYINGSTGVIRNAASSVNDLYAQLTVALGKFFEDGDRLPLVTWALPSEGSENASETAEVINSIVEARGDLEGEVTFTGDEE